MGAIASQITSLAIVYSTVYSDADQRKHRSSASLAFVWGIHRGPVNSPHKWPVTRKMFPFDDVILDILYGGFIGTGTFVWLSGASDLILKYNGKIDRRLLAGRIEKVEKVKTEREAQSKKQQPHRVHVLWHSLLIGGGHKPSGLLVSTAPSFAVILGRSAIDLFLTASAIIGPSNHPLRETISYISSNKIHIFIVSIYPQ